ncbi:MAG: PAS domain S-box protein [Nevskiaceae bacterium]|nr:MAG: PAS domain S-box protein [Nevskiaceae bacterium]TAM34014.1 MAG: PAS domain S-box protein [Nevskiaceae bacterium]
MSATADAERTIAELRAEVARLRSALSGMEATQGQIERARREWNEAFDAVSAPVFLHDRDMRIVRANLAYAKAAGMPIRDLIGKPYWQVFPKRSGPLPGCVGHQERAVTDGVETSDEVVLESGEVYASRAYAIRGEKGEYLHSIHILEDISAERRGEQALRESEARFRGVLDGMLEGCQIIDHAWRYLYLNDAAVAHARRPREQLLGRTMAEAFPGIEQTGLFTTLQICLRTRQPRELETEFFYPDGSSAWFAVAMQVVPEGVAVFSLDITARKRADEALHASRDLLQVVIENIPMRVFWKDLELRYLGCNTLFARDAGVRAPRDLLGKDDFQLGWHEQAELYRADDRQVIGTDAPKLDYEEPQTTADGQPIWLRTSKVPLHDSGGKVFALLGIYDDITAHKRGEQERAAAYERRQRQMWAADKATSSAAMLAGDVVGYARELTELAATAFGVERANIWLFNEDESELRCIDLYEPAAGRHSADTVLSQREFAAEFEAIKRGRYVDADDALTDPRTAGFAESHLKPLGITAMLGAVVQISGEHVGLLCVEHVGKPHHWEPDEISFACQLADKFGLAFVHQARLQSMAALVKSNRALKALSAGNAVLVKAETEAGLLGDMCEVIVEKAGYIMAWVGLVENDEGKRVRPLAQAGDTSGYLDNLDVRWGDDAGGQGPTGRAVRSGAPQVVRDIQHDPQYAQWRERALRAGYASSLALPMKSADGAVFAVLNIYAAEKDAFDTEEMALLQELSEDTAYGMLTLRTRAEHARLAEADLKSSQRLKAALSDAIGAIAMTVEKRDPYTAGHQQRVAELSVAIGRELGLDPDRLDGLRLGATIHDIGKIYVPAEILNRPGRLTTAEFELIKTHPQVGYDIVKDVSFPWPLAQMILQHHERLDGSGYPRGLKGEDIIIEARVLAVADVVEAMSSHRPYRPAQPPDSALREISEQRGRLYDPAVVDVCLRLFAERKFKFSG